MDKTVTLDEEECKFLLDLVNECLIAMDFDSIDDLDDEGQKYARRVLDVQTKLEA